MFQNMVTFQESFQIGVLLLFPINSDHLYFPLGRYSWSPRRFTLFLKASLRTKIDCLLQLFRNANYNNSSITFLKELSQGVSLMNRVPFANSRLCPYVLHHMSTKYLNDDLIYDFDLYNEGTLYEDISSYNVKLAEKRGEIKIILLHIA